MALQPAMIDVPLSVLDQSSPTTSGPLGRLTALIDAEVNKFDVPRTAGVPTAVRVDKRSGFATLSDRVRTVSDGALSGLANLGNQTLLTSFNDKLMLVANDNAMVYSDTTAAWESYTYQLSTDVLSQNYIHTSNTLATTPDKAWAQGVSCHTWVNEADYNAGGGQPTQLAGCYIKIEDEDGVTLLAASRLDPNSRRVKVVSDGGYFWVFLDNGDGTSTVKVRLFDRYGLELAQTTFPVLYTAGDYTDVTCGSFGPLYAQSTGSGIEFSNFSYDPGTATITRTTGVDTTILGIHMIGFLTNDVDGYAYLGTIEHVGTNSNTVRAYRITSSLGHDIDYSVGTVGDEPASITGYVIPQSTSDLVVVVGKVDNTASPNTNYLKNVIYQFYALSAGTSSSITNLISMNVASRAFAIRGHYYIVGYYPSRTLAPTASVELANQPTYFLCPLDNLTQKVSGRFEYGIAYAEWQSSGSIYNFALSSCVSVSSGMSTALSYRAESFTSQRQQVNGDITLRVNTQASTVGIKAFTFGPEQGHSVQYGSEILLPGPQATTWSGGAFSESNVNLSFEPPVVVATATAGSPAALHVGAYQYVIVGEWTDQNGNRVRSLPSPPVSIDIAASQYAVLTGRMMHATNKKDLLISIYRTDMLPDSGGGYVTTTQHYKITVDAPTLTDAPLYNDTATAQWTFSDSNIGITANEILYTDKGQLGNYPAPPFSHGTVWRNRVFLLGYDGAIWFSAEPTEGDALWFHPAFRITLPTTDQIANIVTMDDYILVLCANSLWYIPLSGPLPDSSGTNGTIPTPVPLPFKQGCTGEAVVAREGCYYSSTSNGLWLITRSLTNTWVGEPAADILDGPISKLSIDAKQRVYAVVSNALVVFDTISNCFYEWSTPDNIEYLTTWNGSIAFGDNSKVWRQLDGTYTDVQVINGVQTIIPYYPSVTINFLHIGGVRNYKRLWAVQFIGETHTASTVNVQVRYDDVSTVRQTITFATSTAEPFNYELKPAKQLCSSIGFTITESVTGAQTPDQGYSLELLSFYIGLEPKGLNRNYSRRV